MHHVRHFAGALHEALAECTALVVAIPVEAFGQGLALRRFKADPVYFGKREEERRETLAALGTAEFGRLLVGALRISAGIAQPDDLGAGSLILHTESGVVGGCDWT